ncbi:IS21-like element helper ATPase IstB [Streptomyces sp. DH-12]|uniref:IS21-like element helper ATPase IstB n=1 Tax=Streptomyces sp. DH-12 TaxID=2072509 RepID=UPI00237BB62D|nr:IS21-like element helper ATPase IstB [Streptomyces sp. DH-12]
MTGPHHNLTEPASHAAIDTACRVLRLPTMRSQFPDLVTRAERERMSYRGFLAELLMAECEERDRRRSERRIRAAGFPRQKWLSDFDYTANPNVEPAVVNNLATCEWVRKGEPLCLIGDSGTGKSHLLIGLGAAAAMAGYRVRYALAAKLVNELVEAADEKQLTKTIARYGRVDLLCIDELGYLELDRRGAEMLFQVLTEREEKNSVAIASNESFSKAHMFRRIRARWCRNVTGSSCGSPGTRRRPSLGLPSVGGLRRDHARPGARLPRGWAARRSPVPTSPPRGPGAGTR